MLKLLYVEDDRIDQKALLRVNTEFNLGYNIELTSSFENAIDMVSNEKNKFDLILLDNDLGDGTGLDLLQRINGTIPVIFLTGKGNEEIAVNAMKLGAFDYIVKDVDRNYLTILPTRIGLVVDRIKQIKELSILRGLLSICASCKKIKDSDGKWIDLEIYFDEYEKKKISHGICNVCKEMHYPDL
ncbi:MAG: response regulator [Candidatus Kariarchaeaceae archaeon]|jgi:DNA-binding NtrC family response regulator